jgi:hypothetical protein
MLAFLSFVYVALVMCLQLDVIKTFSFFLSFFFCLVLTFLFVFPRRIGTI